MRFSVLFFQGLALCALCFCGQKSHSADSINYSVNIKNFTSGIWEQNETDWKIYSSDGFSLPSTPFQRISATSKGTLIVVSGNFSEDFTEETNLMEYTCDTMLLDINSTEVKSLSAKAETPEEIELLTYEYITNKTTGIPMLRAKNIIEMKTGDCTEHTVLAAALLRAKGIPARAVMGMIAVPEFNGQADCFCFHMWAEAFYGGKWHLIDATRPGELCYNRYVAFTYHSLKTEMPLAAFKAVSALQNIKAEYLSGR